jgi:hypothetical protein
MGEKTRSREGDEEILIHSENHPYGQQDVTLCGTDLTGDLEDYLSSTHEKINCPHCLAIIRYCKTIKL